MSSAMQKDKRRQRREQARQNQKNYSGIKKNKDQSCVRPSFLKKEHRRLVQKPYFRFKLSSKNRKRLAVFIVGLTPLMAGASSIIPTDWNSNMTYYRIGGGSDYGLPPAPYATPIDLAVHADLSLGQQCGMYNPALSISNTLNDLEDSVNNLTENLIANATGSIAEMPMYFLALANPTLYNLLNNSLINAHTLIDASVKSCQEAKNQISQGQNPYQDWGMISVGDSWKTHLSLTATGDEDINTANATITQDAGDDGVLWVQGKSMSDGSVHAGGKSQPVVHVVADTTKAGYNALLNRDLTSDQPAPANSDLSNQFPAPQDAINWTTAVLGDQNITTCTEQPACQSGQGTVAGRGLLPWMTVCTAQNNADCVDTLNTELQALVSGSKPMTKDNLLAVSAYDLVMSPPAIRTLQGMEASQQEIFIHKLAQEIAMQRVMAKALTARDILQAGRQLAAVATNHPAQLILQDKITTLENEIRSLSFEAQVRKEMMSDTLWSVMNFSNTQQNQAFDVGQIHTSQPMMENSAIPSTVNGGQ